MQTGRARSSGFVAIAHGLPVMFLLEDVIVKRGGFSIPSDACAHSTDAAPSCDKRKADEAGGQHRRPCAHAPSDYTAGTGYRRRLSSTTLLLMLASLCFFIVFSRSVAPVSIISLNGH